MKKECLYCNNEFQADLREVNRGNANYNFLLLQPCAICGWNKASCDVHHIIPVSNGGKNEITNLITLCPNCHRMVHRNLISEEKLKKFRESWTISSPSNEGLGALAGN